jgi:GT2 family glycosyltransferase
MGEQGWCAESHRDPHVLVVAYHNTADLDRCLATLANHLPVLVVDNGSDDEAHELCRRYGVEYLRSPGNIGFAAAVNLGLGSVPCDRDVLLVNPDALVSPSAVRRLADRMRAEPRLAALSPRISDGNGEQARVSWPVPSPGRAWVEAVGLAPWWRRSREFVMGAVLLLRREALDDVGLFDERFFLYAEETDWQLRALNRGWRIAVEPSIEAAHGGSASSSDEGRRQALFHRSAELFIRKWHGGLGWQVFRAAVVAGAIARYVVSAGSRQEHAQRLRLYLGGPARLAGPVGLG